MANSILTDLIEISSAADGDKVYIVDVSDTTDSTVGSSRFITITNLIGVKANSGANSDITSLTGLTTPLTVAQGGSGVATLGSGNVLLGAGTSAITSAKSAPSGAFVGTTDSQTLTNKVMSNANNTFPTASLTVTGDVEIATAAEINTGTDAGRAIAPDGLAGSNLGIRYMQAVVFDFTTNTETGDGKFYMHIPTGLNGMNLVYVHGEVITAGTTNTTDIQIANVTQAADMLSTKLTIDTAETGSDSAATPAVINTSNDDVATNDVIRIDVDAISTTAAKGLIITLGFQLP